MSDGDFGVPATGCFVGESSCRDADRVIHVGGFLAAPVGDSTPGGC